MPKMQRSISHCSLEKVLAEHRLLGKGDSVVIGVSGGVDSMVLLDLFCLLAKSSCIKITVAHINHRLRGKASDADEDLVRKTAQRLGVAFRTIRWKPPLHGNIQDEARRFRYDFFRSVAADIKASCIATAHNLDDQAETVLHHLIRGSGIKGLGGMDHRADGDIKIIRPLLAFDRKQIEDYAKKKRIRFAKDASNKKTKYTRNFIRHKVLPVLESLNPRVRESLADAASTIRESNIALDGIAHAFAKDFLRAGKGRIAWNRGPYLELPTAIRRHVLIAAYEKLKGNRTNLNSDQIEHMEDISKGTRPKARYMLPGKTEFHRTGDLLWIHSINP